MHARPLAVVRYLLVLLLLPAAVVRSDVLTSELDHRAYRGITLDNDLKALLISDPRTDRSAAALDVHVGHGSDPEGRAGLAHFLEHMLFLGTRKYPDAGEYQAFIRTHGGSNNAYTSFDHTNYFFDISPAYLEPALDRFAQFFIGPLFNAEFVTRERAIVHSEYSAGVQSDGRRIWAVRNAVMNPAHPRSGFAVGSLETLADREDDPVRGDLVDFYRRHYSAGIMTLVVLGREPLDQLEGWVREKFSAVAGGRAETLEVEAPLFEPGFLPARVDIVPDKEQRSVTFIFPVPSDRQWFRVKPLFYISHLIGHEGEGSLLAELKRREWATGLSAGVGIMDSRQGTFEVGIQVTEEGLANLRAVGELLFDTIELIREQGVEKWIYDELARIADLGFRFSETPEPGPLVRTLADRMHEYPIELVVKAPYLLDRFDPELIRGYLGYLTPDNVLLVRVARDLDIDRLEPYYQVPYAVADIGRRELAGWRETGIARGLALPERNAFVPVDLALKPPSTENGRPERIDLGPGFELWHRTDLDFKVPRASFYFSVRTPLANDSPRHVVLTELYVALVKDQLGEFSYPARLAGLDYDLYRHLRGFTVRIDGYSDRQEALLEEVLDALHRPRFDERRFETMRRELVRAYENERRQAPYNQALAELRRLLIEPMWSPGQLLDAGRAVTLTDLRAFVPELLSRVEVVALSHGNVSADESRTKASMIRDILLADAAITPVRPVDVVKLPGGVTYSRTLEVDHPDSATVLYFQGRDDDIDERARVYLLAQLLESRFYNELRTVQQLGYIVFSSAVPMVRVPGLAFVVQSPDRGPDAVEERIRAFLGEFPDRIRAMSDEEFQQNKRGLIGEILAEEKQLVDRSGRYWQEIDREDYDFDSREQLAATIRRLGRDEVLQTYRELVLTDAAGRLVVRSFGAGAEPAAEPPPRRQAARDEIDDPVSFKRGKSVFSS